MEKNMNTITNKVGNAITRITQACAAGLGMATLVLPASPVFADDNPFNQIKTAADAGTSQLRTIAASLAILCLVAGGIMFFFGDTGKQKAMKWLPGVLIGLAIISGAVALVAWWTTAFK